MKNAEGGYGERLRQRTSAQLRLPLGFHFLSALIFVPRYFFRLLICLFREIKFEFRRVLVSARRSRADLYIDKHAQYTHVKFYLRLILLEIY